MKDRDLCNAEGGQVFAEWYRRVSLSRRLTPANLFVANQARVLGRSASTISRELERNTLGELP